MFRSILTNRWIQAVGAVTILGIGFFVYQADNNATDNTTAETEATTELTTTEEVVNKSNDKATEVETTINSTTESENINTTAEVSTTEK
jgi:hypothetical protein